MLLSLSRAFAQLTDPRFRRTLLLGLCATLVLYVLSTLAIGWGLSQMHLFGIAWADRLFDVLGGIAVFAVTLFLFPGVATLVLSFLLDDVAAAVEERYYPRLPAPRSQGVMEMTWGALRFTAVTVAVNLLALVVYLPLLLVGIGFIVYAVVNGYLLAREYFELVAWRRMTPVQADALRRAHAGRLWLLGLVVSLLSAIPLVNLVVPMVATAAMVHEVEQLRRNER